LIRSGGLGEVDGVAQCLQLADVIPCLAVLVDAAGVVAGAQLAEAGGRVREQVPDDFQDGAGDSDQCPELAAAPGDAPVALAEECIGPAGRGGCLAQDALEAGVALAGPPGLVLSPGLDGPGR